MKIPPPPPKGILVHKCKDCGREFDSGKKSWFCKDCRITKKRAASRKYFYKNRGKNIKTAIEWAKNNIEANRAKARASWHRRKQMKKLRALVQKRKHGQKVELYKHIHSLK